MTPVVVVLVGLALRNQARSDEIVEEITRQLATAVTTADLEANPTRGRGAAPEFESQLSNAWTWP